MTDRRNNPANAAPIFQYFHLSRLWSFCQKSPSSSSGASSHDEAGREIFTDDSSLASCLSVDGSSERSERLRATRSKSSPRRLSSSAGSSVDWFAGSSVRRFVGSSVDWFAGLSGCPFGPDDAGPSPCVATAPSPSAAGRSPEAPGRSAPCVATAPSPSAAGRMPAPMAFGLSTGSDAAGRDVSSERPLGRAVGASLPVKRTQTTIPVQYQFFLACAPAFCYSLLVRRPQAPVSPKNRKLVS